MDNSIANRPKTPVNNQIPTRSRPNTPKPMLIEKTPINFLRNQPEIEIKPRKNSTDRQISLNQKKQEDDSITITKIVRRPKTPQPQPSSDRLNFEGKRRRSNSLSTRISIPKDIEKEIQEIEEIEKEINPKRRKNSSDNYCWSCHKDGVESNCTACPRSWHKKCIGGSSSGSGSENWICGECASILKAENASTRSPLMANLTVDQLCMIMKHIIGEMKKISGSEPFLKPVDTVEVSTYLDFIIKPMDLSLLENNIQSKNYGSTDAFMADAKWILHNCIVFNTCGGKYADASKLTTTAKQLIKIVRQEFSELEACSSCYIKSRHLPRPHYTFFVEACQPPHPLVWAKLKGFPFWPAKVMPRTNNQGHVDVRFFGEHDRAWVPPKDLFLYSKDPPNPMPRKRECEMFDCLREISIHIKRLVEMYGEFRHAPTRTLYNPQDPLQIKILLPNYNPPIPVDYLLPKRAPIGRGKRRKTIESRDGSLTDDNNSDHETTIGYITEGDEELIPKLKKKKKFINKIKNNEINLNNLSIDLIPGKRPRQCKIIKKTITKEPKKKIIGIKEKIKGLGIKSKKSIINKNIQIKRGRRKQVLETIDDIDEIINDNTNDNLEKKELKIVDKIPEIKNNNSETIKKIEINQSKIETKKIEQIPEKKQSRAKKSFPNKPPQIISYGSLKQIKNSENKDKNLIYPEKKEKIYEIISPDAGPLSSLLNHGAHDLAKQMSLIIEESIKAAVQGKGTMTTSVDAKEALIFNLKLKIERMKWQHQQQVAELKHNTERTLREMRSSLETERIRSIEEITKSVDEDKAICIALTKEKQWCANCSEEATMYCCWNTNYCSENCQTIHWRIHSSKCRQFSVNNVGETSNNVNGEKEISNNMPKLIDQKINSSNVRGA